MLQSTNSVVLGAKLEGNGIANGRKDVRRVEREPIILTDEHLVVLWLSGRCWSYGSVSWGNLVILSAYTHEDYLPSFHRLSSKLMMGLLRLQ